jgi:hypothetical protein
MTASPTNSLDSQCPLAGTLHLAVAFDWGDEIDLEHARRLAPGRFRPLARRPRTPPSIAFRPPPLRFQLPTARLAWPPLGPVEADCEATVFDFGGVSVALHVPFQLLPGQLVELAGTLGEPELLVAAARGASEALFQHLLPAIRHPLWSDLSEEYVIFHFAPGDPLPAAEVLVAESAQWLASLVRLDAGQLSPEEVTQSLRMRLSYTPADLLVLEWSAAVLVDSNCEETLQTIEFANLQLLEFRHTDNRLDDQLAAAYALIHSLANSWLPFWRTQARPLRVLGDLKIEANVVFERTSNVLKLMGDQYLARVYRMLAARFHLDEWTQSIQRSLSVVESVYQSLSDQAAKYRTEILELIVVLLIAFEIFMAWLRR